VRLIAAGAALILLLILVDMRVRPIIRAAGEFHCRVTAARVVAGAVTDELENHTYGELMHLSRDDDGNIISIESDMVRINRLKARVTQLINEDLAAIEQTDLPLPLGTISGVNMLYGRGPAVPVRLTPRGSANITAGINQTLHRIIMEVEVEIAAIIPGFNQTFLVTTNYIVAETVIVGEVPNMYAQITTAGGELFNRLEIAA
jgi:sporulation protein YunB